MLWIYGRSFKCSRQTRKEWQALHSKNGNAWVRENHIQKDQWLTSAHAFLDCIRREEDKFYSHYLIRNVDFKHQYWIETTIHVMALFQFNKPFLKKKKKKSCISVQAPRECAFCDFHEVWNNDQITSLCENFSKLCCAIQNQWQGMLRLFSFSITYFYTRILTKLK